jgi:argininosuccinate lyase
MWESLLRGFSQATDLAELVMQTCAVDYRTAYNVVGAAVRAASRQGLRGVDLNGEMLDDAANEQIGHRLGLAGSNLGATLDPRSIVMSRLAQGGAAPQVVREMAVSCRAQAHMVQAEAERHEAAFNSAEASLLSLAEEVARG